MTRSSRRHYSPRDRALVAELDALERRIAKLERDQSLLYNTLSGLARESDLEVSIGSVCTRCTRSYVLIANGTLYCPKCHNRRTV